MTDDELERLRALTAEAVSQATDETKRHFDASTAAVERRFETATAEMKQHFDTSTAEMKRHFDITAESMKHEVQLVAEGLSIFREDATREISAIHQKMDRGFADTQSMIKFSHAELEKRVRALEEGFADLMVRVDRLESTTH